MFSIDSILKVCVDSYCYNWHNSYIIKYFEIEKLNLSDEIS